MATLKKLEAQAFVLAGVVKKPGKPSREQAEKRKLALFCASRCFELGGDEELLEQIFAAGELAQAPAAGAASADEKKKKHKAKGKSKERADSPAPPEPLTLSEPQTPAAAPLVSCCCGGRGATATSFFSPVPTLAPRGGQAKQKVYLKIEGDATMDMSSVQSLLTHLVRDGGISSRREDVVKTLGEEAYYLRPRRPAVANAKGHIHVDEVDHTFECQMAAHVILQTREFHPMLRQLDLSGTSAADNLRSQPQVVQNALHDIKGIQNCTNDETLFNLKLLNKSLNITKGHAIHRWLDSRSHATEAKHLGRVELRDAYRRSAACTRGEIDHDEADELAARLSRHLFDAEETYKQRLKVLEESAGNANKEQRDLGARFRALQSTISDLQDEHELE